MAGEESGGGSRLLVLGRNGKCNPDRSQAHSQNKAIVPFERSHKDSAASAACLSDWQAAPLDGKGDGGQINSVSPHMRSDASLKLRTLK